MNDVDMLFIGGGGCASTTRHSRIHREARYAQAKHVNMIWHKVFVIALCCSLALLHTTESSVAIAVLFDDETTILEALIHDGRFDTLVLRFSQAGTASDLAIDGPYTLFAPTDYAFDSLPKNELDTLTADPAALQATLRHHLIPEKLSVYDLAQTGSATTSLGSSLSFIQHGDELMADGAIIERNAIDASNGVIYVINRILVPSVDDLVPAETVVPAPEHTITEKMTSTERNVDSDMMEPVPVLHEDAKSTVSNSPSRNRRLPAIVLLLLLLIVGMLAMLRRR